MLARRDQVDSLGLERDQHRWLVGALRDLELDLADPGNAGQREKSVDALLDRALSYQLSGRQRAALGDILRGVDERHLRDLIVLLASGDRERAGT